MPTLDVCDAMSDAELVPTLLQFLEAGCDDRQLTLFARAKRKPGDCGDQYADHSRHYYIRLKHKHRWIHARTLLEILESLREAYKGTRADTNLCA